MVVSKGYMEPTYKTFDGSSQIIYSGTFNIYNNKLTIKDLGGKDFIFIFENSEPVADRKDVTFLWSENNLECQVTVSKKFRNSLGAGTTDKVEVSKTEEGDTVSFSIFGHKWGEESLSITISFYSEKKI